VQSATHPAGGAWQTPVENISAASAVSVAPRVVDDSHGDATAVWASAGGGSTIVQAATRPAAGDWQPPVNLSPIGEQASDPQVAVDPQGDTVVVWLRTDVTTPIVQAAVRPAGGTWQPPIQLSATADSASAPQLALDSQGNAVAIWLLSGGTHTVVQVAERPVVSGVWQTAATVSNTGTNAGSPDLALDPQGNATAIWSDVDGVEAAERPAGGAWGNPAVVPGSVGGAGPRTAVDAQGDVAAVWNQTDGSGNIVAEAAVRPTGGTWQTPVAISSSQQIYPPDPEVGVDARGDAVAVWNHFDGTGDTAQAAVRPAGGVWQSTPTTLSSNDVDVPTSPEVAVDPQGNATAVWQVFDTDDEFIQAAGYDASGPELRAPSIPTSGTAGKPVAFSVSPVDVWSPVATTEWSFGDGQRATDEIVTHAYAKPGRYTVSVTSSDTLGNATTSTAKITISTAMKPTTPTLTHVSEAHKKWREGRKPALLARAGKRKPKRPPLGTSFSFTLNETARVTLAFTQTKGSRKAHGTLTYTARTGRHKLSFDGRIASKKLPLGAYTLRLTATDTTTGKRSRTTTLRFTIVK
jgi:hypothetical protein